MKITKLVVTAVKCCEKVVDLCEKIADFADRVIHKKQYEKERRQAAIWRVLLCVACGVLGVLFLPYRIVLKKNGYFEVNSLLFRVHNDDPDYVLPADGDAEFDIVGEEDPDVEVVEAAADAE